MKDLEGLSTPVPIIPWESATDPERIPGSEWLNPVGSLDQVGAYEMQQQQIGNPVDPLKMIELSNSRELHLEVIGLDNGIRYVTIKDKDGNEALSDTQYSGLISCGCGAIHNTPAVTSAENIRGTDLGDGYELKMILASLGGSYDSTVFESGKSPRTETHSYGPGITSYVEKQRIDDDAGVHQLDYTINPHEQRFSCSYSYYNNETSETVRFGNGKTLLTVSVMEVESRDQIDIQFTEGGAIEAIALSGRYLIDDPEAQPEMLAMTADARRSTRWLKGADIDSPLARSVVADVLGIALVDGVALSEVRVNFPETMASLITNLESDTTTKPHTLLAVA